MTTPTPLGATEVHDLRSDEVGDTFRIFLGRCGDAPSRVLVVTDANGLFGLVTDTVRLMQIPGLLPSLLVVGIGYPSAPTLRDTADIRARDLAPTAWSAVPGSGGADRFLDFVRSTLFPWLAGREEVDLTDPVYFGHSLGGLFGACALLGDRPVFRHLVLSSPSLYWDRYAVFGREEQWAGPELPARVFAGIGALETDEGRRLEGRNLPADSPHKPARTHLDMVGDLTRFAERLRRHPRLELEFAVYPDEFHATVPGTVLTHGLRYLFGG
jgi:predicted alpha/beta superfamily hydrolase